MRVLIAPDKFKGTLTAHAAANAIARGWKKVRPDDSLTLLPFSDGGDGFGSVLAALRKATPVRSFAVDAAGRRRLVRWWWDESTATAIIESARVIGLAMLPPGRFHPFNLDTRGLGMVLRAAIRRGARRCILGIGGSATNDGGFGMAQELGWQFLDVRNTPLKRWTDLKSLSRIAPPAGHEWPQVTAAVDVQNRLLGAHGCTRVYGPQKGLLPQDFARAEAALARLAKAVSTRLEHNLAIIPGAGAAGGLGFGLLAFAGAQLTPGFEWFARESKLDFMLQRTDLVITGEGRLDRSTFMGKGTGELAARCRKTGVPIIALAGEVSDTKSLAKRIKYIGALTELTSPAKARADARHWLTKVASQIAHRFSQP